MALKRMVLQIGMGTDIRGADYTKAAVRALRDALWHNSLSIATALGQPLDAMIVDVHSHAWSYPQHFSDDFRRQAARARAGR